VKCARIESASLSISEYFGQFEHAVTKRSVASFPKHLHVFFFYQKDATCGIRPGSDDQRRCGITRAVCVCVCVCVNGNLHTVQFSRKVRVKRLKHQLSLAEKFLTKGNQNGEVLDQVCFGHNLTMVRLGASAAKHTSRMGIRVIKVTGWLAFRRARPKRLAKVSIVKTFSSSKMSSDRSIACRHECEYDLLFRKIAKERMCTRLVFRRR
jgi:hypothetical protein